MNGPMNGAAAVGFWASFSEHNTRVASGERAGLTENESHPTLPDLVRSRESLKARRVRGNR